MHCIYFLSPNSWWWKYYFHPLLLLFLTKRKRKPRGNKQKKIKSEVTSLERKKGVDGHITLHTPNSQRGPTTSDTRYTTPNSQYTLLPTPKHPWLLIAFSQITQENSQKKIYTTTTITSPPSPKRKPLSYYLHKNTITTSPPSPKITGGTCQIH